MDKYPLLEHEPHRAGEHELLDVATGLGHAFGGVGVVYGRHVLGDDRPGVELGGDEMGRGPDQLHAAGEGLPVGACAGEGREERVMDVDHPAGIPRDEFGRQDPHVAGEHDVFRVVGVDRGGDRGLV